MDTQYSSVEELLGATLTEEDHDLPSGRRVRIRALSRATVLRIQTIGKDNVVKLEAETIAAGLVAPAMTVEQVGRWQAADAAGGDIGKLMEAIRDLSGLGEGAAKAAYKSDGAEARG
jgi:hypothetical protein